MQNNVYGEYLFAKIALDNNFIQNALQEHVAELNVIRNQSQNIFPSRQREKAFERLKKPHKAVARRECCYGGK